jgi:hypothetical protein
MHAKYVIFNDCCDGKIVEQIGEELPHSSGAILSLALSIETIDLSDLSCLVVASQ